MAKPVLTPEEIAEREARTTSPGLYHYARSYHDSARALQEAKVHTTHRDVPVAYLYYHAIELFLKTYLRLNGHTVDDLERHFGHNIKRMRKRCTELGFDFMDEDLAVFEYMEKTDTVIRSRYIATGYFTMPSLEALDRTCTSLRHVTCEDIRKTGVQVRP